MPGSVFWYYPMKTLVTKCWQMVIIGSVLCLTLVSTQVKSRGDLSADNSKTISATYLYTCGINIDPSGPTITDTIRITAGGEWPDTCVPKFESYQMTGSEIRLDFTHPITIVACAPVIIG